MYNTIKW